MFVKTIELFEKISDTNKNVKIYLKHHPRFNNCIDISSFYNYDFVLDSPNDINKCFELCSLHITEYSTMVFDGLSNGIPSLFTRFCSEFSLFDKDYNFPYSNSNLLDCLDKLHKDDLFNKILISQTAVSKDLYEPFNENLFVKIVSK
jgi:hypothetical protein